MGTADASNDTEKKVTHFSIPANQRVKRYGMDFYETTLGSPKYVVSADGKSRHIFDFVVVCCQHMLNRISWNFFLDL